MTARTETAGRSFSFHCLVDVNKTGVVLPSTGGIGTTIFYVLGGLLVVGAAVILVARKKASN